MRFSASFCVVLLLQIVRISTAIPSKYNDVKQLTNEVNPSLMENFEGSVEQTDEPVEHPTGLLRNKRYFDYSDYSSQDSSDEGSHFGYFNKPYYHSSYEHRWHHPHTPPPRRNGYGFWPLGPTPPVHHTRYHNHQHDNKKQYLSKIRRRRDTASVDSIEDQEYAFPTMPLFVSTGDTDTGASTSEPTALPQIAESINLPEEEGISQDTMEKSSLSNVQSISETSGFNLASQNDQPLQNNENPSLSPHRHHSVEYLPETGVYYAPQSPPSGPPPPPPPHHGHYPPYHGHHHPHHWHHHSHHGHHHHGHYPPPPLQTYGSNSQQEYLEDNSGSIEVDEKMKIFESNSHEDINLSPPIDVRIN